MELAKRSFAVGRNAHLVVGYTAQMIEEEEIRDDDDDGQPTGGAALLRKCWYAVMGEERLKREAGPDGYRVVLPDPDEKDDDLVTVGDIWELAEGGQRKPADPLLADHPKLKDLCVSFALFKLLAPGSRTVGSTTNCYEEPRPHFPRPRRRRRRRQQ